jgi:hypothetical protein
VVVIDLCGRLVLAIGTGPGHDVAMPQPVAGRVELWDGWSIELPSGCMSERNPDGSWSAWDATRVVDIHIVTVGGNQTGRPITAEQMLGQPGELRGPGWIATRQLLEDRDDRVECCGWRSRWPLTTRCCRAGCRFGRTPT